ncbi:Protein GrpE [Buchnera aphidicola (Protaphis terricola)]|uniref:nucleotide exchange factor GrpE n=1 Tax=Buchnera aphidicola TaxID=9 RepID=UPI003463A5A0
MNKDIKSDKDIIDDKNIDRKFNKEISNDSEINENIFLIKNLENELETSKIKIKNIILKQNEEIFKIKTRLNKEIEKYEKFSLEKLIFELLPIIDNIERAFELIKQKKEERYKNILKKIEHFFSLIKNIFDVFKISKINEIKVPFNPDLHQAISINYTNLIKSDQIIEIMQSGYLLNNSRLLRPAMVVVSKNKDS